MSSDDRCTIRVCVPEEFMGFSIQELVSAGGTIQSITSPAPGRQTIEAIIPARAYDALLGKISEYVRPGEATFQRADVAE